MPQHEHESSCNNGHMTNNAQNFSILQVIHIIFVKCIINIF